MDRYNTDQIKMSLNFIDYMCLPLFSALRKGFAQFEQTMTNLNENRKLWEKEPREREIPKPSGHWNKMRQHFQVLYFIFV